MIDALFLQEDCGRTFFHRIFWIVHREHDRLTAEVVLVVSYMIFHRELQVVMIVISLFSSVHIIGGYARSQN
jgi:hypothetical protein